MKEYICKCNMCDATLIDENPQVDAIKHDVDGTEIIMVKDKDFAWVCPNCKTDKYLIDL